uniref:Uncharacterized protein n=1 Tax=Strongyloides venezuelensis TaxID=75913 RepID=A0A0K0G612_STRVS
MKFDFYRKDMFIGVHTLDCAMKHIKHPENTKIKLLTNIKELIYINKNKPIYSLTVVYCPECAMPFKYCRENNFTQSNQEIVKDVEEIMITDNDVAKENKHYKHEGLRFKC